MDDDVWAEFGKNLSVVMDFNYFPKEWVYGEFGGEFIDFAKKYKKDFNSNKDFQTLFSLDSFDTDFTGFYKILSGEIRIKGDCHDADFVYLKNGKLKYSQAEYSAREGIRNIEQIFYDEPFYISKRYYSDNQSPEREMINSYGDLNEKYLNSENPSTLLNVQRGGKFCWDKGFSLRYTQFELYNSALYLYKKGNQNIFANLVLNSKETLSDFQYLEEIKKNPSIFQDFNLLKTVFGDLEVDSPFQILDFPSKRRRKLKFVLDELENEI